MKVVTKNKNGFYDTLDVDCVLTNLQKAFESKFVAYKTRELNVDLRDVSVDLYLSFSSYVCYQARHIVEHLADSEKIPVRIHLGYNDYIYTTYEELIEFYIKELEFMAEATYLDTSLMEHLLTVYADEDSDDNSLVCLAREVAVIKEYFERPEYYGKTFHEQLVLYFQREDFVNL